MNKKEFVETWETIKVDALPLVEQKKQMLFELKRLDSIVQAHLRRKFRLQHTFFGCYNCSHAVDSKLGRDACCNYPGGLDHEGRSIHDLSHLREETPACFAFGQGAPQREEPDPLKSFMRALFSERKEDDDKEPLEN